MFIKPLERIAAERIAQDYIAQALEPFFWMSQTGLTEEQLFAKAMPFIEVILGGYEYIIHIIIGAIESKELRAELFWLLQTAEFKSWARENDIDKELIQQIRYRLSESLEIPAHLTIDSKEHIEAFNFLILGKAEYCGDVCRPFPGYYSAPHVAAYISFETPLAALGDFIGLGLLFSAKHYHKLCEPSQNHAAWAGENRYVFSTTFSREEQHIQMAKWMYSQMPSKMQIEAIRAVDYQAIRLALCHSDLNIVQWLYSRLEDNVEKLAVLSLHSYHHFQLCAMHGHIDKIKWIEEQFTSKKALASPEKLIAAIRACNYSAIMLSTQNGKLEVVKHLLGKLSPIEKSEVLMLGDYLIINHAAKNGGLALLKFLLNMLPLKKCIDAVTAQKYRALNSAIDGGHITAADFLYSILPEKSRDDHEIASSIFYRCASNSLNACKLSLWFLSRMNSLVRERFLGGDLGYFFNIAVKNNIRFAIFMYGLLDSTETRAHLLRDGEKHSSLLSASNLDQTGQMWLYTRMLESLPKKECGDALSASKLLDGEKEFLSSSATKMRFAPKHYLPSSESIVLGKLEKRSPPLLCK